MKVYWAGHLQTACALQGKRCQVRCPGSVGVLGIEGHLDPLYLVTQLDGWTQLQLHTLLDCGQGQQQQRLAIYVLLLEDVGESSTVGGGDEGDHVFYGPLQRVPLQHQPALRLTTLYLHLLSLGWVVLVPLVI